MTIQGSKALERRSIIVTIRNVHFGRKILRVRVGIDEFSVCVHAKSRVLQIEPGRSCEEQMNRRRTREEEAREEEKRQDVLSEW